MSGLVSQWVADVAASSALVRIFLPKAPLSGEQTGHGTSYGNPVF